jgi:hypothetical protein
MRQMMAKVSSFVILVNLRMLLVTDASGKSPEHVKSNRHSPSSIHRRITGHEHRHARALHSRSSAVHRASENRMKMANTQSDRNPKLMRRQESSQKSSVAIGSKASMQLERLPRSVAPSMPERQKLHVTPKVLQLLSEDTAESEAQASRNYVRGAASAKTSAQCAARCSGRTTTAAACLRSCESSLQRLRSAADSVSVEQDEVRKIPFPHMQIPREETGKRFDGMMFAGGASIGGHDSFVARICTSNCADYTAAGLISKVVVGELKPSLVWKEAAVLEIPHSGKGLYVGPEDPRLDVVNGSRFILANVNVDVKGCQLHPTEEWKNPRQMFFSPVDAIPDAQPCLIQLEGEDPCKVQKNWAPLVPLHSSEIYFVYSIAPFRVLRFSKNTCAASTMPQAVAKDLDTAGLTRNLHGGTRFVHGLSVPGGELYVAFAHTAPPAYEQLLVAVLSQHSGDSLEPSFRLIGVSCPIQFGKGSPRDAMMIATSIISFDSAADLARVTYQQHDSENYHTEVRGMGQWLKAAYAEFLKAGPVYCTSDRADM